MSDERVSSTLPGRYPEGSPTFDKRFTPYGESYILPVFNGKQVSGLEGNAAVSGGGAPSTGSRQVSHVPPVVLGPGASMRVLLWFPANSATGISLEFEAGWIER